MFLFLLIDEHNFVAPLFKFFHLVDQPSPVSLFLATLLVIFKVEKLPYKISSRQSLAQDYVFGIFRLQILEFSKQVSFELDISTLYLFLDFWYCDLIQNLFDVVFSLLENKHLYFDLRLIT